MGVFCGKCKLPLDDLPDLAPHKHAPCPVCKSTSRIFDEHIIENGWTFSSHLSALKKKENKVIDFSESEREGRAASATLKDDGTLAYSLTGTSPQGEEDTQAVCQILVNKLNSLGANWDPPTEGETGDDGKAVDRDNPKKILRIQVVHASVNQKLWQELNHTRGIKKLAEKEELAQEMKAAVESKIVKHKILPADRPGLVLALDATRLPVVGFDAVVEKFHLKFGVWAKTLGFDAIWVVGPDVFFNLAA